MRIALVAALLVAANALPQPAEDAGRMHNEGLDFVLEAVRAAARAPQAQPRTREDLERTVDASARRFLSDRGGDGAGLRTTAAQQAFLDEIDRVIADAPRGRAWAQPLAELGQRARRELSAAEAEPVVMASSVASASLTYWSTRGDDWESAIRDFLGDSGEPPARAKIRWWLVAGSDVVGAVCGASLGVVGAVSGAVIASAGAVLREVLSRARLAPPPPSVSVGPVFRRDASGDSTEFLRFQFDTVGVEGQLQTPELSLGSVPLDPVLRAGIGRVEAETWPRQGPHLAVFRGRATALWLGAGVSADPCDDCGLTLRLDYEHRRFVGSSTFELPTAGAAVERMRLDLQAHEIGGRIGYPLLGGRVTPYAGVRRIFGDAEVRGDIVAPVDVARTNVFAGADVTFGRAWSAGIEIARTGGAIEGTASLRYHFGGRAPATEPPPPPPLPLDGVTSGDGMLVFDSQATFERIMRHLSEGGSPEQLEARLAHRSLRSAIAGAQTALENEGALEQYNDPDNHFVQDEALRAVLNARNEVQVGAHIYVLWDSSTTLQIPVERRPLLDRLRNGEQPGAVVRAGATIAPVSPLAKEQSDCKAAFDVAEAGNAHQFTSKATGVAPITHYWSFGDGSFGYEQDPQHTFTNGGPFQVCLTTYDATGCTFTACRWVKPGGCNAFWSATLKDHTATFAPSPTVGSHSTHWDFGDGTTSTDAAPTHEFTAGDHYVCLTVKAPNGCTDTHCDWIRVRQPVTDCCDANDRVVNKWTTYANGTRRFKSVLWMRQIPWISHAWGARTIHYEKRSFGGWRRATAEQVGVAGGGTIYFQNSQGDRCATPEPTSDSDSGAGPEAKVRVPAGSKFWAKARSLNTRHWVKDGGRTVYGPLMSLSSDCARKNCKVACAEGKTVCTETCTQAADQCKDVCTQGRNVCLQSCSGGWFKKLFCKLSCRWQAGSCKRECRKGKRECKRDCRKTARKCRRAC